MSLHRFSVGEAPYEGHAHMPIMVGFARLGLKWKYCDEVAFPSWTNVEEFSRIYSEVMRAITNYKSERQIRHLARQEGLAAAFSFSSNSFTTKLQRMMHRPPHEYGNSTRLDAVALPRFKNVASITLSL